jgi:hypothetical protein
MDSLGLWRETEVVMYHMVSQFLAVVLISPLLFLVVRESKINKR